MDDRDAARATLAAWLQVASPFVFVGTVLAGLVWEIPSADPHGYTQVVGLLGSVLLLLPALGVALPAVVLLKQRRRGGAVLLVIASVLAALESLGLAAGVPGGITEVDAIRALTIAVGVVWLVVSVLCAVVGIRVLAAPEEGAGAVDR